MRKLTLAWACLFLAACLSCAIPTLPQKPAIDPALARQYFAEARKLSEADGGRLWGKPLYGPMLFADPGTSFVVASQADAEGRLKEQDGVFVGTLPPEVNVANTATVWAGVKWTMVMWPLPSSPTARARLMMHELFHALQDSLGLPAASPANAHLSMLEGRIWLQLEWRALRQALARPEAPPAERKRAVEDVLLFRLARRALFPKAEAEERGLEMNEGLAEYTGYKLRGTADAATAEVVIARLGSAPDETSFSRSFAYASGPAYGMLLDLAGASWRKGLTPQSDFGELLRQAYGISLPRDLSAAAAERAAIYDGVALRWSETRQAEQRKALADSYRRRLLEGPVLILPVAEQFSFSFDPNAVIQLDDANACYRTLRATDSWGVLEVSDGALVVRGQSRFLHVAVQAPSDATPRDGALEGPGWKLTLSSGWQLAPGPRAGDHQLTRK